MGKMQMDNLYVSLPIITQLFSVALSPFSNNFSSLNCLKSGFPVAFVGCHIN